MDDIARLPETDRSDLFRASAGKRASTVVIVEKDFWVCWVLRQLFRLPDPPAGHWCSRVGRRSRKCGASLTGSRRTSTCPSTGMTWGSAAILIRHRPFRQEARASA